ncbi:3-oxoacyl-[acyl-carrier-protein] synthase 3 [termite gut metagenome]|uniref:3-oxoacyl-[acyl-carrier-protein] synthase 3 n=1 Tax=termite gut metagenome TaxID=433724 RepID=A0A5J4RZ07_9ZZZZ
MIIGTGSYIPELVYTNEYLETILPTDAQWIFENVGIKKRHIANKLQATSDLAAEAGRRAILNAGLKSEDIELIIVATSTPDRKAPSTAAFVQHKISAINAVAFDITAICSGFLFSMSIASQYIEAGIYNNILVIGADTFSKITDWKRRDAIFFGDGAGAVVISVSNTTEGL